MISSYSRNVSSIIWNFRTAGECGTLQAIERIRAEAVNAAKAELLSDSTLVTRKTRPHFVSQWKRDLAEATAALVPVAVRLQEEGPTGHHAVTFSGTETDAVVASTFFVSLISGGLISGYREIHYS